MIKKHKYTLIVLLMACCSCKKLVEANTPINSVSSGNVFTDDATAIGAVTNIYASMSSGTLPGGGVTSLSLFPGLSADELSLYAGTTNNAVNFFYSNSLSSLNINSPDFWTVFYKTIYSVNDVIEGLSTSSGLTPAVKQQLSGEVKFMRAFCYFYLTNLYGDVPLVLSTDYMINDTISRTGSQRIYQQVIADLKEAENQLSTSYLSGTLLGTTQDRVRPTKWVASSLLARVYLFTGDFADAESEAGSVIGNTFQFSLSALSNTFLKNNSEAIWQLQPVSAGWNTQDARTFLLPPSGLNGSYPFFLSPQLLSSFERGDGRRAAWIDSVIANSVTYFYAAKYKSAAYQNPVTEYATIFRLAEQYLIRAEARVQQSKLSDGLADLNAIRSRAGLPASKANDKASLLSAILHERQVEFFTEWGHRWFDLKRTGTIDAVMAAVDVQKGGTWNSNWQWYPISRGELQANPHLVQNNGYN